MKAQLNENKLVISGEIDQDTNFDDVIPQLPPECVVNLKQVTKINSTGVKHWIDFFEKKVHEGIKFTFEECSIAVVEQLNMVKSFSVGSKVQSFEAPFICNECEHEWSHFFSIEETKGKFPSLNCPKCNSSDTEIDEIEDEYLAFNS